MVSDAERNEILKRWNEPVEAIVATPLAQGLVPIKIKCPWASCSNERHSLDHFQRPPAGIDRKPPGYCQDCGERVVFLPEPGEPVPLDDEYFVSIFAKLQHELIRSHYWTSKVDLLAFNQAYRYGRKRLFEVIDAAVRTALMTDDRLWRQRAPYNQKIVGYAQHATGTCCRQCAAYWHGLPRSFRQSPSEQQLAFMVRLAQAYIDLRFPLLPEEPTKVTPVRPANDPGWDEIHRFDIAVIDALADNRDPSGLVIAKSSDLVLLPVIGPSGGAVHPSMTLLHQD